MTSAAEEGGGFKMLTVVVYKIPYRRALVLAAFRPSARASKGILHTMTVADKGGGGVSLTSAKILKFWKKLFQIKRAYHYA